VKRDPFGTYRPSEGQHAVVLLEWAHERAGGRSRSEVLPSLLQMRNDFPRLVSIDIHAVARPIASLKFFACRRLA